VIYYAIKHKLSGGFLPQLRRRRGHTHTEPLPLSEAVPRLHRKLASAKVALYWWLQGKGYDCCGSGEWDEPEYEGPHYHRIPERKRADMEIVQFSVRER
jgi:hypothetical protein